MPIIEFYLNDSLVESGAIPIYIYSFFGMYNLYEGSRTGNRLASFPSSNSTIEIRFGENIKFNKVWHAYQYSSYNLEFWTPDHNPDNDIVIPNIGSQNNQSWWTLTKTMTSIITTDRIKIKVTNQGSNSRGFLLRFGLW